MAEDTAAEQHATATTRPLVDKSIRTNTDGSDIWADDFADLEGTAEMIHNRNYVVRAFRLSPDRFLLRGVVDDTKPGWTWIEFDTEPVTMHHMVLDMVISFPELVIVEAKARMLSHPHAPCPSIEGHYDKLVGLSIARGFTHKVRELFGGPKGCTHVTALIQAMAPVAMQTTWPMNSLNHREEAKASGAPLGPGGLVPVSREEKLRRSLGNLNTCHMFAEDGELIAQLHSGIPTPIALTMRKRIAELGLDPEMFGG